jgi:predicted phosphoribosyltransferase
MVELIENRQLRNRKYVFRDRSHAGEMLALQLKPYMEFLLDPIVLAIPSGGVPVGAAISKMLGIPMDLIIVRKLPIPHAPEAGFGSISWDGKVMINERLIYQLHLSEEEISSVIQKVGHELDRRMERFRGKKPFPELKARSVLIVDDGLASGYTMLSAVTSIRRYSPAGIVVAVPTASSGAVKLVSPEVDKVFCLNLRTTAVFAVADAYQEWHDLTEKEVLEIIRHIL